MRSSTRSAAGICPAYFNITSAVDEKGLPSEKLCPRDAIARKPIGKQDPEDPSNNFYEYVIDEEECDGDAEDREDREQEAVER